MSSTLAFFTLVAVGVAVVALAHTLAMRRRELGGLSRQFVAGIAIAIGLTLVGLGAWLIFMMVDPRDAWLTALVLLFAGALAGYAAVVLSRGVKSDIESVRDGLERVGGGSREPIAGSDGRDELAALTAGANRMIEQLAERELERDAAEQARRDLVAAVSHDLRTPLTSLQLVAQAIEDDLLDETTRRRYLSQMSLHIESLSGMVDDLFELSRLEAGDIQWSMRQVELADLVEETVEAMRAQADAKRVAVEARIAAGVSPARANPEKVQRVLFNLIQNAIRHTPADGSVTVMVGPNGSSGTIEVAVADTGGGVEPADRERVFEPFYRADSSRTTPGSGLGLAICRAIVELHGGRIWLDAAEPGGPAPGTRVRFTLPRA